MEFFYFGVHSRGLMNRMIIGHLDLQGDEIKDRQDIGMAEFQANKHEMGGDFGQLPALKLADGTLRSQNKSIARFLSKKYKSKTGDCLYPGHADSMMSYYIDNWLEQQDELAKAYNNWSHPIYAGYKEKDKNFLSFISTWMPNFLKKVEDSLDKNGTKWLCADHITLADFAIGCHIVKLAYNHK